MSENKQKSIFPFFKLGRHEKNEGCFLRQRYFELSQLIRNKSNFIILPKQTAKTLQSSCNDRVGFDMIYEELKNFPNKCGKIVVFFKINRLDHYEKNGVSNENRKKRI